VDLLRKCGGLLGVGCSVSSPSSFQAQHGKTIPGPGTRERNVHDHDWDDDHGDDWDCHYEDSHDDYDYDCDYDEHEDYDSESCDY